MDTSGKRIKRWFYITAVQLSPHGGQSTHIMEICRTLASLRPTTLFAPVPPPENIPALSFYRVPLPTSPPRELLFQIQLMRSILLLARSHRPDIIYVRASSFNLGAIMLARMLRVPCVLELNGLPAMEYSLEHHGKKARARAMFYTLMERLEHRLASGIVVVTPQLGEYARRNGARHIHVTLNGVDPAAFTPHEQHTTRRDLGLPEEAEIIGYVGTFSSWQGLDTLIEGAKLLAPHRPALLLYLIGDGPQREYLHTLAEPLGAQVHFAGRMPHSTVGHALSACDVLAAPFAPIERNRRMGISALKLGEYMGMGRPILGSLLSGMEFIEEHQLGALFEAGNPAALAQQIEHLLDMPPDQRAAIGQRARQLAETTFSWEHITERIVTFAEELGSTPE